MTTPRVRPTVSSEWPDPHELTERVRSVVEAVEGFIHLKPGERRRINTAATLPTDFYSVSAGMLDAYEWLAASSQVTGAEVRRMLDDSPGYDALAVELEILARGIRSTLAARRAVVGQRLLTMYEIARRSNRSGEESYVKEVELLEQILRSRRRSKAKEEPEPEPPT